MKNKLKKALQYAEPSILSGILLLTTTFLVTFYWQFDGFGLFETCLLPFITGLLLFIILIVTNIIISFKKRKNKDLDFNKYERVLIVLFFTLLTYIVFDSILYFFDDSLSKDYAIALNSLSHTNEMKEDEGFENLPFGLQNLPITIIFGLFGSLCVIPFIRKNH